MKLRQILLSGTAMAMMTLMAHAQTAPAPTPETTTQSTASVSSTFMFTNLSGADAVGDGDASLGKIEDLIVDGAGNVKAMIVARGGLLGIGATRHEVAMDHVPAITDGKVHIAGQSAETIAALPEYKDKEEAREETREDAATDRDSRNLPVSGANQTAPQSATADIPVPPNAVSVEPVDPGRAETPEPPPAKPTQAADVDEQAEQTASKPVPVEEESAAGSGSTGMAPQQGTGTGATQASPQANEGEQANDEGNEAGTPQGLNEQYGRDEQPAVGTGHKPGTVAEPETATSTQSPTGTQNVAREENRLAAQADTDRPAAPMDNTRWRLGRIVGQEIRGMPNIGKVQDMRLSNAGVEAVLIRSGGGDALSEVAFSGLNLGGTTDRPIVALDDAPAAAPRDAAAPTE